MRRISRVANVALVGAICGVLTLVSACSESHEAPAACFAGSRTCSTEERSFQKLRVTDARRTAESLIVGAPAASSLPAPPAGFVEDKRQAATEHPLAGGGLTEAVYEDAPGRSRIVAIRDVSNREPPGEVRPPWRAVEWVVPTGEPVEEPTIGIVLGLGVSDDALRAAAHAAVVGQNVRIPQSALPDGFRIVAEGDTWSALSRTGVGFRNGAMVRFVNSATGAVVEYTASAGDERLDRLARAIVDPATGRLPWDGYRAVVRRDGTDVIVVAGNVPLSDLTALAAHRQPNGQCTDPSIGCVSPTTTP